MQAERAVELLREMQTMSPDELRGAHGDAGGDAKRLTRRWHAPPDVTFAYNAAIHACAAAKPARWEQALALLNEMSHAPPEAACAPDAVSFDAALTACANAR